MLSSRSAPQLSFYTVLVSNFILSSKKWQDLTAGYGHDRVAFVFVFFSIFLLLKGPVCNWVASIETDYAEMEHQKSF